MVWSHLRQRIPPNPAGTRDTTKQATACSPVQADNEGREQPNFSSAAGNRPILGHTVTNLASFHPWGNTIWGYLVNHVGPKSQGADTVWGGHKDPDRNRTSDKRGSGLREQQQGHKSKLIVFRLLLYLFNLNQGGFLHACTSESCRRAAQYRGWSLGVTASPVTLSVGLMKANLADVYSQFTFRQPEFEMRSNI